MAYIGRRFHVFAVILVSILLWSYMTSIVPLLIRSAIDEGVISRNLYAAVYYAVLVIAATIAAGGFSFIGRYLLFRVSQEIVYRIRMDAYRSLQIQSMEFFDKSIVGQLISRITNDAERVNRFLTQNIRLMVFAGFTTALSTYYMIEMNALLATIAFTALIASLMLNIKFATTIRPLYDETRHMTGVIAGIATSALAGIKTVKGLAIEDYEYDRFTRENDKLLEASLRAARLRAVYGNAPMLIVGTAMAVMLYYGGYAIPSGTLTVGELTAFLAYMLRLMWPLRALGFSIGEVQRAVAAAKRLFEIIDAEPRVKEDPNAIELRDIKGEIVFENVSFSYIPGKPVLRSINLHVRPGEKIAIVGPPGSGKSTLLKLLVRFYDPDEGKILIDGIDIRRVKLDSLRRHVVYIPQEPFIFNRSIRENIALGNPSASIEDIVRAAKIAKIHDFIELLPRGYETIVGEKGVTLSGGQRQRIALARALLANPKILLLDDPVSNLDAETEKALLEDLREVLKDKTALIVTQRLSLIDLVDRIIVMEDGRIIEEGSHEELLARKGAYYRLYNSMLGGGIGERVWKDA